MKNTIEEIILSVIQFDADIKKNNAAGLPKFIDDFIPLLRRFKSLIPISEIDSIEFKNEFSGLFTYLFVMGKIYEEAGNLITDGAIGTIIAIKKNGDPLSGNLRISPDRNLFKDFVKKYQNNKPAIKSDTTPNPAAWAYCFSILREMDSPQAIEHSKITKKEAILKLAQDNHFYFKSFETEYNFLKDASPANKTTSRRIPTIRKAIELFNEKPELSKDKTEGLAIANKYLKIALLNA